MERTELALINVPSSAGARRRGQERAPEALRSAGLRARLEEAGFAVTDRGGLHGVAYRPDPSYPKAQNGALVCQVASEVSRAVSSAARDGLFPVVLGGDCSITVGVLAGLVDHQPNLGLLYFDADLDLNIPETTPSGIFDGMVTAHILGRGYRQLATLGPRTPLLDESQLLYFGYDASSGAIDPDEISALEQSASPRFEIEAVRRQPRETALEALAILESRVDRLVVHFDVDVTDLPAVDVAHPGGLSLEAAASALEIFLASPKCAALVVTEFNADLDANGSQARRLAGSLAAAVAGSRRPRTAAEGAGG